MKIRKRSNILNMGRFRRSVVKVVEKKYIEKLLDIFRTKDPRLADLVEKLGHVFKEGGCSEKAWVRGVIEEAYDEVVAKSSEQKNEVICFRCKVDIRVCQCV